MIWLLMGACSLAVFAVRSAHADALPHGLPAHAPLAATSRQPTLPEPSSLAWPFPNTFPHTSGAGRLAGGASLWSDFVFDDHGAALPAAVPLEPLEGSSILTFWQGDYAYRSATAKNDGADIFRAGIGATRASTYWRVDWNTLAEPTVPIAEWTFDTDDNAATGSSAWPAGAGVSSPGIEKALLVSSRGAWLIDPATGARINVRSRGGSLTVDRRAQSFIVRIPRSLLQVSGAWRIRLASGLANPKGNAFASPTLVGGGPVPPGYPSVYNVTFRRVSQEPPIYTDGLTDTLEVAMGKLIAATPVLGSTYGLDGQERAVTGNFWSEDDQADALNSGNVSKFSEVIHWSDLERRVKTAVAMPRGYSVRWYVSRFHLGGGLGSGEAFRSGSSSSYNEIPQILSRVQPYSVYVPHDYTPRHGAALTFTLHSLETDYGQYAGLDPRLIQQLCEQRSSICVSPEGLGPSGDWAGKAQADLWQVWRAVADAYNIDPNRTVLSGYSMGGEASNTLGSEHPDLYAGAMVLDGSTFSPPIPIANLRWVPYVIDNTIADELDPSTDAISEANQFDALGQRYTLLLHSGGDHITFATEDRFDDAVAALGEPVRELAPGKFSYTWSPATDSSAEGIGATGDYWLDHLMARSTKRTPTIIADDHALPFPRISSVRHPEAPVITPTPGFSRSLTWQVGATPPATRAMTLALTNVAALAINTRLAKLPAGRITIKSDGPVTVTFEHLPPGTLILTGGRRLARTSRSGTASVRLGPGAHVLIIRR